MSIGSFLKEKIYKGFYSQDAKISDQYPSVYMQHLDKLQPGARITYQDFIKFIAVNNDRKQAYRDFDDMDSDIIAAALDLYADDATQFNIFDGESFYIECEDSSIKQDLEDLFFNTLEIDEHIWDIARMVSKYGDFFLLLEGDNDSGIKACNYSIHPRRVTRIDREGRIKNFVVDDNLVLAPWDFCHFRLPGSLNRDEIVDEMPRSKKDLEDEFSVTYGMSTIYRAREVWKKLRLLEDSLVMSRLSRATKRNVFAVNTAGLKEPQAWDLVDKIQGLLKRSHSISTRQSTLRSSNLNMVQDEDIVIPVNADKGNFTVQELGGDVDVRSIADVDYLTNKLFAALKIPKAFLGFEDSLNGRNTLRMLDVRYARTIKNLQRVLSLGMERIARIHLSYKGYNPFSYDITVKFPYISTIEEEEKAEALSIKVDAASKLVDLLAGLSSNTNAIDNYSVAKVVLKNAGLTQEDIDDLLIEREDMSQDAGQEEV